MKRGKKKQNQHRLAAIKNVEMYNVHLRGKINDWPNERLLLMVHPNDRSGFERLLKL